MPHMKIFSVKKPLAQHGLKDIRHAVFTYWPEKLSNKSNQINTDNRIPAGFEKDKEIDPSIGRFAVTESLFIEMIVVFKVVSVFVTSQVCRTSCRQSKLVLI